MIEGGKMTKEDEGDEVVEDQELLSDIIKRIHEVIVVKPRESDWQGFNGK